MQQMTGVEVGVRVADVRRRGRWTVLTVEVKDLDRTAGERMARSVEGFVLGLLARFEPKLK